MFIGIKDFWHPFWVLGIFFAWIRGCRCRSTDRLISDNPSGCAEGGLEKWLFGLGSPLSEVYCIAVACEALLHSTGRVAQRDGQVARATLSEGISRSAWRSLKRDESRTPFRMVAAPL